LLFILPILGYPVFSSYFLSYFSGFHVVLVLCFALRFCTAGAGNPPYRVKRHSDKLLSLKVAEKVQMQQIEQEAREAEDLLKKKIL